MSLLATTRAGVATAFSEAGDLLRSVTISKKVSGAYDPQTQQVTAGADQGDSFTTRAVEGSFGRSMQSNGVTIQQGDLRLFIQYPEATFAPTSDHKATYAGQEWAIVGVMEHVQALYELHLRRMQ